MLMIFLVMNVFYYKFYTKLLVLFKFYSKKI